MSENDPRREFATEVVRRLQDAGYVSFWAGGCVRDLLMGRRPGDYDVATSAHPSEVRRVFGHRRTLSVGESFGVIIVLGPTREDQIEVATFRTEGPYLDGRRPEHVSFCSPDEDAHRRDFTINGMFFDPLSEQVFDYVDGQEDLTRGIVRAIGRPQDRMAEDKLRMLRAVRFAATLDFELDETTAHAIEEMADQIAVVSPERIAQELKKMLVNRHRRRAVRMLQQHGLLQVVFPELETEIDSEHVTSWSHTLDVLDQLPDPGFELAAAALLHTVPSPDGEIRRKLGEGGTVRSICRRLRLSNKELEHIAWLVANQDRFDGIREASPAELKTLLAHPLSADLLKFAEADARAGLRTSDDLEFVRDYLARTSHEEIDPPRLVGGADLREMGLRPGPEFKHLLDAVRIAQLNGEISSRDEALQHVRLLREGNDG
ncbi:tRNA nucleotidyltransferase/poly(A) polymerase [Maioricimonas rarisocia]|uniref:tRNA nucleotidyltransferase/poly(A) polymerase n=1 Tax=Maioricimonas rarisocia TaxID=2528026 RepID=A0A517Z2F0_9PLAN|nr:CCA tRNA nucleotidyltransferase [Maioricimonas rarisocia]QDU36653.1 tRNA nucleotidyltransferase/poly(A) polymerase [Maioricimonas rarisocia]